MSKHLRPSPHGRTAVRLVTAAFVASFTALAFAPLAHAGTDSTLAPTAEAWYQPDPSCSSPSGCSSTGTLPATSPYPDGTMHIAFSAGKETARSYVAVPFSGIIEPLTGASLSVPLDTAQADGDSASATAKIQVCLTSATFEQAEGSFAAPPKSDCSTSVPATYVATPQPHLQADLGPLLTRLSSATGLVLLPDATKNAATDSWRVVFSTHNRADAAKTPAAAVTVTVEEAPVISPSEEPTVTLPESGQPDYSALSPPVGTGFAPAPSVEVPVGTGTAPSVIAPPAAATTPLAQSQIITVAYAYPAVWLLPLGFLVLIPMCARALTKDLIPVT